MFLEKSEFENDSFQKDFDVLKFLDSPTTSQCDDSSMLNVICLDKKKNSQGWFSSIINFFIGK